MKIKSLALAVKFLLLAVFTVSLSFLYLITNNSDEETRFSFFIFGVTYSLFIYTFGGVEKSKVASFNSLILIYSIGNIFSFLFYFAFIGFFQLELNFKALIAMCVLSCFFFPLLVFFTYYLLFRKLSPMRCLIIGSQEEWRKIVTELAENSLIPLKILDYISLVAYSEENLKRKISENRPVNFIISTNFQSFREDFLRNLNITSISINVLMENYCKKIPIQVISSFEEYYRINFSSINVSRGARIIDTVVCFFLLLLSSPLLIVAALCILIFDGGPIFFTQERHGYMGKIFLIYKLRTWDVNDNDELVSTKTGNFLRKIRLNEIPQLYNVIKGDMSLVGPRPDVPSTYNYCIEKIPFYHYRYFIKPGITGHAQVSYKYIDKLEVETFANRLSYDLFYVKNNSFFLYLTTLLKTIESIFFLRGS